ncbi:glycosyltransferase family 2 protein [Candidatus Nitrososphaera gargensis]|nr:glycosyltransferase [Candidatus Nitrososphaera gargensis]
MQVQDLQKFENTQTIDENGRIVVKKYAKALRFLFLSGLVSFLVIGGYSTLDLNNPFMIYSTIVPIHSVLILIVAWGVYRDPAKGQVSNDLVSVVIPIYNQKSMIRLVIDSIFQSTYQNIEVIAVNDGSKDGTKEVLDELAHKYPKLKVLHKKNAGKRKAIGTGFMMSRGKYVVFIDSDSIVHRNAVEQFVKTFNSDKQIGAVVGNAKVWNASKNIMTKLQSVWYDVQFNIHKTCESTFGLVICCSGCLCAYRREAISEFIPRWTNAKVIIGDDRELTSFVTAKPWSKPELLSHFAQTNLDRASRYDDAEDRVLTAQTLVQWKAVYVASAVVFTDVPEKFKGFIKQQVRWKRGYLRAQFFVSSFFWHNNPLMVFIFYLEFMASLTMPLIIFTVLVYEPFFRGEYMFSIFFAASHLVTGLIEALDSKFRNPNDSVWKYKPMMNVLSTTVLSWLVIYSWLTLKTDKWGTR